jgi:transposase
MRTLDLLNDNYSDYLSWLFRYSNKIVKRDTSRCYYDCTNFYCETESEDDDYEDEVTGEKAEGLRQYGPSKERKGQPIVEMGLFMDRQGIPLSMCIHPGNKSEQRTAVPLEEKLIRMFQDADVKNPGSFIYVADGGLGSSWIREFNAMGGRSFIVTQSIKKLSDQMKEAVFNDCDYWIPSWDKEQHTDENGRVTAGSKPVSLEFLKTFDKNDESYLPFYNASAYKVIEADSLIDLGLTETKTCKNGHIRQVKAKGVLKQKLIIRFSRKYMEYQRFIRNRQIERAREMLGHMDPDDLKKSQNDAKRFIKKHTKTKSGEGVEIYYTIDEDRIAEEEKYDGFYALATNLQIDMIRDKDSSDPKAVKPDMTDILEIISISETRNKIEDCFRIMKTNFDARPIYHRKPGHIIAHFMICYTALLIYRLLEVQLNSGPYHCTTNDIIETLNHMVVGNVEDMYYQSLYGGSKTLTALNDTFGGGMNRKRYLPKTLNKISRSF